MAKGKRETASYYMMYVLCFLYEEWSRPRQEK